MTIREIIASALRKLAIVASGETPSSDEMNDGLSALQSIILDHPGLSAARWRDTFATSDAAITAKDGYRIHRGDWSPTITLPTTTTWSGSTRAMPELARVQIMDGADMGLWLFSGIWRKADGLTLDSDNPFGPTTDDGLSAQLAVRIGGDFGQEPTATTMLNAMRSQKVIRGRLYRDPTCEADDFFQLTTATPSSGVHVAIDDFVETFEEAENG